MLLIAGSFVTAALAPSARADGTTGPSLTVNPSGDVHSISPLIYGMNAGIAESEAADLRIPIQRWGGDATTRYNWKVDSSNAGGDWYFMGGGASTTPVVPSAGPDALENLDLAAGGTTDLTIPIIPWINNSATTTCSYPETKYPDQQSYNPYVTLAGGVRCGDGLTADGTPITDTDISSDNTANSPSFQEDWVKHLVSTFGTAANGGVGVYQMDNEPSGWNNTHRDIHPAQTGWDELVNLTEQYAAAVKDADPTAAVDGPGDFGWPAYIDGAPSITGDNRLSHGGVLLEAEYYLQQMALYQHQHGTRLLDYFDEHYYPTTPTDADSCIALCEAGDAATQAARLQATRSLWDPSYVENDWIGQYYGDIDLIPRMKQWIQDYYPGTKTAITEYNFGALDSMNGALAQADALGIFGAQGLDMADLWSPPTPTQPGAFSFAMYRNYDGNGSGFGDTSVQATSTDQSKLSVYAAKRTTDGALTVMVINKTPDPLTSSVGLGGFAAGAAAQDFTYDADDPTAIVHQPDVTLSSGAVATTFAPNSITLLVVPAAPTPAPSITIAGSASVKSFTRVGVPIAVTYNVTNAGNDALSDVTAGPDASSTGPASCPQSNLAPGATERCVATHRTTQADLDRGRFSTSTLITATADGATVTSPSATVTVHAVQLPKLRVERPAGHRLLLLRSDRPTTLALAIRNDGNVTLHNLHLAATPATGLTVGVRCAARADAHLAPDRHVTCHLEVRLRPARPSDGMTRPLKLSATGIDPAGGRTTAPITLRFRVRRR